MSDPVTANHGLALPLSNPPLFRLLRGVVHDDAGAAMNVDAPPDGAGVGRNVGFGGRPFFWNGAVTTGPVAFSPLVGALVGCVNCDPGGAVGRPPAVGPATVTVVGLGGTGGVFAGALATTRGTDEV